MIRGITFGAFDLFHTHGLLLNVAKEDCEFLVEAARSTLVVGVS